MKATEMFEKCYQYLKTGKSVMLEASAGTGKTYTITHTVRKILSEAKAEPEKILILTFTDKATNEMKEKLLEVFSKFYEQNSTDLPDEPGNLIRRLPVMTIDGFFSFLLKNYLFETGVDPDFTLVAPQEIRDFLIAACLRRDWFIDSKTCDKIKRVLSYKNGNADSAELTPEKLAGILSRWLSLTEQNEAEVYFADDASEITEDLKFLYDDLRERYNQWLALHGLKTYASILDEIHQLSAAKNSVLSLRIKSEYQYVFIDEFQDTNKKQWEVFQNLFAQNNIPLCLVGDPKQAIYAFRQADLENYLNIRDEIKNRKEWEFLPLDTNWRSSQNMVAALNRLFSGEDYNKNNYDFFLMNQRMKFEAVKAGLRDEQAEQKFQKFLTNHPPICFIKPGGGTASNNKKQYGGWIAKEIQQLVTDGLAYSDICILVESKSLYQELQPQLKKAGIPYFYYKEEGILESEAAENFRQLLNALAESDSSVSFFKAIVTAFFGKALSDLHQDFAGSAEEVLYSELLRSAENREWPEFFRRLRQSAVWEAARYRSNREAERMLTDYRQLFEMLEDYAIREQCDIGELAEYLAQARRQSAAEYDLNLHAGTETKDKVQIMTMHQSKGLEFPVVFALLRQNYRNPTYPVLLDVLNGQHSQKIVYLQRRVKVSYGPRGGRAEENISLNHYREQNDREQRRLAYVAFTRAKYRLYIPVAEVSNENRRLTAELANFPVDVNSSLFQLTQLEPNSIGENNTDVPDREPPSVPLLDIPAASLSERYKKYFEILSRSRKIVSYSSLSRFYDSPVSSELRDKDTDEPLQTNDELPAESLLPRGIETGLLLHEVLEHCDFSSLKKDKISLPNLLSETKSEQTTIRAVEISREMQRKYQLKPAVPAGSASDPDQVILEEILKIIWHAVNATIPGLDISLADLKPQDCLRELPFIFMADTSMKDNYIRPAVDYVTGVIDLVFRYNDKVYFADYKSNLIPEGISLADYDREEYALQRLYYRKAIDIWLQQQKLQYGGNFYFYLRYCEAGTSKGIMKETHAPH